MQFYTGDTMRFYLSAAFIACLFAAMPLSALELSFIEAQNRLAEVSDAMAGSQSQLENRQHLAKASKSLSYPEVTLDVRQIRFAKTVYIDDKIDLDDIRSFAQLVNLNIPSKGKVQDWRTRPIVTATLPLWRSEERRVGKECRGGV